MKRKRHELILKLIEEYPITTQDELLKYLFDRGFDVTQATVSRDIKELNLIKTSDNDGNYRYGVSQNEQQKTRERYDSILSSSVIKISYACNMICVTCHTGMAQAACFAIDKIKNEKIIGTLAGDDTIFIMCKSEEDARDVCRILKELTNRS